MNKAVGFLPLALCLFSSPAGASSALPGFTGALTTPTAFSQAFQSGAAGVTRFQGQTRAYLNYGAWETGEATLSTDGRDLRVHAKYTLLAESPHTPALAVGETGLLGRHASVYAVAGGNLWVRDGGSRLRLAGGVASRGVLPPLFASAEVRVSRVAAFLAEWSRQFNFGLSLHPTAEFRVTFALVRHRGGLGVSYDIGL
jgi:hypothetical protein